jgi:alpha-L-fucosidase
LTEGQRIASFTLERETDDAWKAFAAATTVGYKRLCRFDEVTASRVRIRIPIPL